MNSPLKMPQSKDKLRVAVLASTSGSDLPAIFSMNPEHYEFVFLLTNNAKAGARDKAKQFGVPDIVLKPTGKSREQYGAEILKLLNLEKIDLVLLVGWMRLLSKELVEKYYGRMMNVHPSLLPAFGGGMDMNVHEEVLKAGVKETGATIHFVTEEADAGPILMQRSCTVDPDETVESLKEKVQKLEQEMFPEVIEKFRLGKLS